jgi:hypothetical protein
MWEGPEANGKITFKISEHGNGLLVLNSDRGEEKELPPK